LIILCFAVYALMFWVLAIDGEDRTTIYALRKRAAGILTGRRATPAMQVTGNNSAL
jgi:hypothetical protein